MKWNLIFSFFIFSNSVLALELPSYDVLLKGQQQCSDEQIRKIPWETKYKDFSLANKTVTIISDINLQEKGSVKGLDKKSLSREFLLKYKVYARIICGEEVDLVDEGKGKSFEDSFTIALTEDGKKIDLFQENEHKPLEYFLSHSDHPLGGDAGSPPKRAGYEGLSCLVTLDDLLAKSLNVSALKNICKGESKTQAAKTKSEIEKLQQKLKQVTSKKTKA